MNIVPAGIAGRCEVQISNAIDDSEPTSISATTFGTGKISDEKFERLIRKHFDLHPYGIIQMLDLIHPMCQQIAAYGHFGSKPVEFICTDSSAEQHTATVFSGETIDAAEALRADAKLR